MASAVGRASSATGASAFVVSAAPGPSGRIGKLDAGAVRALRRAGAFHDTMQAGNRGLPTSASYRGLRGSTLGSTSSRYRSSRTRGPRGSPSWTPSSRSREAPSRTTTRSSSRGSVIFVWYGEDLAKPDRPFPVFFEKKFDSSFVSSSKSEFVDTHIMDFVENGSDNLHFQAVHLWEYSKIFNHECNEDTITLQQHTRFRYGLCSAKRLVRWFARLAPKLELEHDYVYHGPGLAVVGNKGAMVPDTQVLVSLTPQGENGTRVYVTIAAHPDTFKPWQEWIYGRLTGGKRLCNWLAGVMCNYTKNEFDVDKIIWENKKYIRDAGLLPGERELRGVMSWGEKFYPKDFRRPELPEKTAEEREWRFLDDAKNIRRGKVHSYSIDGEELIARRDEAGDLRVFDAFCPHQGAHLGRGGRLTGDGCLRCPFHAFSFDAAGGCHGQNGTLQSRRIPTLNLSHRQHRITEGKVEVLV